MNRRATSSVSVNKQPFRARKAIVVPYFWKDGVPHFLMLKDRASGDWTFVSGGCKQRPFEEYDMCANRELTEETIGLLKKVPESCPYYHFEYVNGHLPLTARVYVYQVPSNIINSVNRMGFQAKLIKTVDDNKRENVDLQWFTPEQLRGVRIWDVLVKNVLNHPHFARIVNSTITRKRPNLNSTINKTESVISPTKQRSRRSSSGVDKRGTSNDRNRRGSSTKRPTSK